MEYSEFYKQIGIANEDLKQFFSENKYSGYPNEPGGSVWEAEGKSIYNLIRFLKPKKVLEIGNYKGVSSNHILSAVAENGFGDVTLLDIVEQMNYSKLHSTNFNRIIIDSLLFLKNKIEFDFIILDGCHEYEHVKKELQLIYKNNTKDNYYIWVHDYFTLPVPHVNVKDAWDETVNEKNILTYKVIGEGSNCGFVFSKINN